MLKNNISNNPSEQIFCIQGIYCLICKGGFLCVFLRQGLLKYQIQLWLGLWIWSTQTKFQVYDDHCIALSYISPPSRLWGTKHSTRSGYRGDTYLTALGEPVDHMLAKYLNKPWQKSIQQLYFAYSKGDHLEKNNSIIRANNLLQDKSSVLDTSLQVGCHLLVSCWSHTQGHILSICRSYSTVNVNVGKPVST